MVVVAEWVTAADILMAVSIVCRTVIGLHPIASCSVVVTVARWYVIFTALVCGDAEVSTPAIGALDVTFSASLRWALDINWVTEWAIVAVADLVVLAALRLARSAPLTEATLHVAELVWLTLVIGLTGSSAFVEGKAAQVWVFTGPITVTRANVHITLLREAGAFEWIAEVPIWAVFLNIAG